MNDEFSDYGLWWLVAINSLVFIVFAFSFFRPKSPRDWRSFGAFSAFLIALFTEMYGFPLTIYLLSGWLTSRFPGVDWYAHDSGHLLEMMFGWSGNPHAGPFHALSSVFIFGGFILLMLAWRVLYRAQRAQTVAMTGPYALVRHPQYAAFILIMFGFLLQWPTLLTLLMFPILVFMYVRLARREEREALAAPGEEYRRYMNRTPAFFPTFRNVFRLAVITSFVLALPAFVGYLAFSETSPGVDTASYGDESNSVGASALMGKDMERARAQADGLQRQMRDLNGTADTAFRRDLVLAHLDALRQLNKSMHEMNSKMIADVDKGKIVSDTGLKQRLELDTEVMNMQIEMLTAQTGAADKRRTDASTSGTDAQR